MTLGQAEKILNLNPEFKPYSQTYLAARYKKALTEIKNSKMIDLTKLKAAEIAYETALRWSEALDMIHPCFFNMEYTQDNLDMIFEHIVGIKQYDDEFDDWATDIFLAIEKLIPKESLIVYIDKMGGIRNILASEEKRKKLAKIYGVSLWDINLRLCEFYVFDVNSDFIKFIRAMKVKRLRRKKIIKE